MAAAYLARRAAAAAQRRTRADGAGRTAAATTGRGRALHRRRATAPAREARPHRSLAGQRSLGPVVGGSGPTGPALRGELVAGTGRVDPGAYLVGGREGAWCVLALSSSATDASTNDRFGGSARKPASALGGAAITRSCGRAEEQYMISTVPSGRAALFPRLGRLASVAAVALVGSIVALPLQH